MATIKLKKINSDFKSFDIIEQEYLLLNYFIADYRRPEILSEIIEKLKHVANGEKTFDEIRQHPQVLWSFGEGSGIFECDKDTAYFESEHPDTEPSMEIPLQELIGILERWKDFLEKD
jgi:hypothetical protein